MVMRSRSGLTGFSRAPIVTVVLVSLTGVGGCWWRPFHQAPALLGVVIITLDTTRADRLSPYGFMDAAMPHLDLRELTGLVDEGEPTK